METLKHTPGPWEVYKHHYRSPEHSTIWLVEKWDKNTLSSSALAKLEVFDVDPKHCTQGDLQDYAAQMVETEANAALIAEAGTVATETGLSPRQLADQRAELLDALFGLVADCDTYERVPDGANYWIDKARAAIAQATQL